VLQLSDNLRVEYLDLLDGSRGVRFITREFIAAVEGHGGPKHRRRTCEHDETQERMTSRSSARCKRQDAEGGSGENIRSMLRRPHAPRRWLFVYHASRISGCVGTWGRRPSRIGIFPLTWVS